MMEMGNVDRISALPDELLIDILGFMSTREAVCTTVLSKRWINLWTRVTTLDVSDDSDFVYGVDTELDYKSFARFVSRVLYFPDPVDIQKCRLFLNDPRHHRPQVADWICAIARRNVVELELDTMYPIPQDIFWCKTLRILKLPRCGLDLQLPSDCDPPELPNLKVLHVTVYSDEVPLFVKLVSKCPGIELLNLTTLSGIHDDIHVSGSKLKTLKMNLGDSSYEVKIYINAPMLENFHLRLDNRAIYSFHINGPESFVDVSISFYVYHEENAPQLCCQLYSLLDIVSSARYLSLSAGFLLAIWFKDRVLPGFGNLNQLKLSLWNSDYVMALAAFLKCAPILEDIVLVDYLGPGGDDIVFEWNEPEEVPACLLSHLKTISISGFKGQRAEIEMAKYLLRNAPSLKNMTISADVSYAEENWDEEFTLFQGTTTCQVEFIWF